MIDRLVRFVDAGVRGDAFFARFVFALWVLLPIAGLIWWLA